MIRHILLAAVSLLVGLPSAIAQTEPTQAFRARVDAMKAIVSCGAWRREFEGRPLGEDDIRTVTAGSDQGIAGCQLLLGRWHQFGLGMAQNFEVARVLYESASAETPEGLVALGEMAERGHGRSVSYPDAIALYTKASLSSEPSAFVALGRVHEQGLGVPPDARAAADHYRKATRQFNAEAWKRLYELQSGAGVLTPEELAADRLAWQRELITRTTTQIQNSRVLSRVSKPWGAEVEYTFPKGETKPKAVLLAPSGDPQIDNAVLAALATVRMPPAPIHQKGEESFVIKLPLRYEFRN